ncbi:MAG: nuclear transport factor 2 family protein [Sedimentisphaerales bacterium]|nr:nuclear transport factor 2 family protein [Sedimentisphaerales bacterium]
MKKIVSLIIVLTFISILWAANSNQSGISPAQQKAIENDILKVHKNMQKAAESLNADELFKYVLDVNDVIIENGELRPTRKEAYENTKQGLEAIKAISYNYKHINVIVISQTAAVLTGSGTTTATFSGDLKIEVDFVESIVYAFRDGQWKVINAHRSSSSMR